MHYLLLFDDGDAQWTAFSEAKKNDRENLSTQCAYMYSIFREILDNGGETDYKLPHEDIRKRGRGGGHFEDPLCTEELKLKAEEHISRLVESSGSDSDTSDGETA